MLPSTQIVTTVNLPISVALSNTVNTVNPPATIKTTAQASVTGTTTDSDASKAADNKDKASDTKSVASKDSGAKLEDVAKKMYCN